MTTLIDPIKSITLVQAQVIMYAAFLLIQDIRIPLNIFKSIRIQGQGYCFLLKVKKMFNIINN
ncbi:hypothetical protein C5I45_09895 [Bacillus sp. ZY-1-1]|nr:hypothetical protein C5I45_09895 [Bacillus sp. ZY-1-1]